MLRARRFVALAGLAGAAVLLSSSTASAAEIRVCENSRLRGPCIDLRHGVNDLRDWGISNRISSFSIESGSWLMCTRPNFEGRCETFFESIGNLHGTPFQDAISSLRPVREGGGGNWGGWSGSSEWQRIGIAVFTDRNYSGKSWVFSDDVRNLSSMGMSNRISSVRVLGGRWRLCRQADFRGCIEVEGDVSNLRDIGFNDQISSIQELGPRRGGRNEIHGGGWSGSGGQEGESHDGAVLYERPGFGGRSITVDDSVSNLRDRGFNDRTRSIRVRGRWLLCSDADFRGECVVVRGDVEDLSRLGIGSSLSSLRRDR